MFYWHKLAMKEFCGQIASVKRVLLGQEVSEPEAYDIIQWGVCGLWSEFSSRDGWGCFLWSGTQMNVTQAWIVVMNRLEMKTFYCCFKAKQTKKGSSIIHWHFHNILQRFPDKNCPLKCLKMSLKTSKIVLKEWIFELNIFRTISGQF